MSQFSMRKEDELLPPGTAATEDMFASYDPAYRSTRGEDGIIGMITPTENQSSRLTNAWMDSRIGTSKGQFQYENEVDMWSQIDDNPLTDEEAVSEHDQDTPVSDSEIFSRHERLRMLALRRHIDSLSNDVVNKERQVWTTREELKKCRSTIECLELEQDQIYQEVGEAGEVGNMVNVYRLESKHNKVCTELEAGRELEMQIMERLANVELELSKADLERGRLLLAEEELKEKEQKLEERSRQNIATRAKKEKMRVRYALKRFKGSERDHFEALKERDRKQRQALSAARRSQENVAKYINETISKVRQQKEMAEARSKEHMQKRVNTLLTLKTDIKANRENLTALQARNRYLDKKAKDAEEMVREDLKDAGRNVEKVMLQKKKSQHMEAEKRIFQQEQKQKQAALISVILEEERQMKKRQKMYPQLFDDPKREKTLNVAPLTKRPLKILNVIRTDDDDVVDSADEDDDAVEKTSEREEEERMEAGYAERPPTSGKEVAYAGQTELSSSDEEDGFDPYSTYANKDIIAGMTKEGKLNEELAQPEFEGLWNKTHTPYKVAKDEEVTYTLNYPSKMEKEIMANALDKHRAGIIRKQIAAGREFKGFAFVSKPSVVHFKDFDVGKTYKKKIILTNVSYSVNFLKLLDLSEHLKDFVDLQFQPPGQMSAGMSCDMLVSFKPLINEDLSGEVQFSAQTGPVCVPIRCTTKKCDVSVDTDSVDFGTQVIGETLRKTITLVNKGARGTKFEFIKITGMKQATILSVGTSLGRMTTADESSIKPDTAPEEDVKSKAKVKKKGQKTSVMVKQSEEIEKSKSPEPESEQQAAGETGPAEQRPDSEQPIPAEEEDQETDWIDDEQEDYLCLDGMRVGRVSGGEIDPFGSLKLEIIYQPTVPVGKVDVDFELRFSDENSSSIPIKAYANAIDVPVWVERKSVDLKICMFDRLYQDAIVINNRATTALRLTMEVCKEVGNHLELLPKTAYIQAQSQFSVQMKFLPRQSLIDDAGECFDRETGVLEAPMTIRVADQTAAVQFTVHAIVTSSDLEFDQANLDFGFCTIHESVIYTVHLTNKSILSQKYGFVNLPEYVAVQPNDGFGTLLPCETITVDIIFSAQKAKDYSFQLTCKSGINRDFLLSCKAVGVHTPLELSHSVIHFAATALEDSSVASFYIINSHTDGNEFTHPVPRVGQGPVAPIVSTSFEFMVPDGAPISLYPSVGTVKPGKKTCISVKFSPSLSDEDIRGEAIRLVTRNLEAKARKEYEEEQAARKNLPDPNEEPDEKKPKKGGKKPKSASLKGKPSPSLSSPKQVIPLKPEDILSESDDYGAGRSSLLRQFSGRFSSYTIPCFVASGVPSDPGTLPFDVNNTLYVHVHCPEVKPSIVVISNHGHPITDFGEMSIGQRVIKTITVQNISDMPVDLTHSVLDCHGPFQVLNATRSLVPDATHTIVVAFEPFQAKSFYEVLDVKCVTSTIEIVLKGQGLQPSVKVSVPGGVLDLGYVLAGEDHTETFQLENSSVFAINYRINLDSLTRHKTAKQSELTAFITRDQTKQQFDRGPANYNGRSVFDCIPCQGTLEAGKKVDVSVTFYPDHPSELYADVARIELFGKEEGYVLQLKGAAKTKIMYITGGDEITPRVESLTVIPTIEDIVEVSQSVATPVLLTFRALSNEEPQPAMRQLNVGCVRTTAVSQKKNGEFFFDNLNTVTVLGFQVDPMKGMVDAGNTKPIIITWSPPKGHNPNFPMESSIILNVKGDVLERYNILLHALVVTKKQ